MKTVANTGLASCLRSQFEKTTFMNENNLSYSLIFYGKSPPSPSPKTLALMQ